MTELLKTHGKLVDLAEQLVKANNEGKKLVTTGTLAYAILLILKLIREQNE